MNEPETIARESYGQTSPQIEVLRIEGRYPYQQASILRSENIETSITSYDDGITRIRLGDKAYDDMWMELAVRVSGLEQGVDDGKV